MKKLLVLGLSVLFLVGCGTKKVEDQEVFQDIASSLEARWDLTDNDDGNQIETALAGTQAELKELYVYGASETMRYKNDSTEKLLKEYINILNDTEVLLATSLDNKKIDLVKWEELKKERSKILYELNEILPIPINVDNTEIFKEVLTYTDSNNNIETSEKEKIGFNANTIQTGNFNELVEDDFKLVDTVDLNDYTMDVFSNDIRIIKLLVFTKKGEEYSSAFSIVNSRPTEDGYSGVAESFYLTEKFERISQVLTNTIPQETIHFISTNIMDNEDILRSDYIYADDVSIDTIDGGIKRIPPKPQPEKKEIEEKDNPKKEVESTSPIPDQGVSALNSARNYLNTMPFSKRGLLEQLSSEYGDDYPIEAAQYAVDNVTTDWKENALKSAESYQETMPMSTSELYEQLVSDYGEKYTAEEAQYAIDNLAK